MPDDQQPIDTPTLAEPQFYRDAPAAVDRLIALYDEATDFLCARFSQALAGGAPERTDRKSTRLNSSHPSRPRMPSSA